MELKPAFKQKIKKKNEKSKKKKQGDKKANDISLSFENESEDSEDYEEEEEEEEDEDNVLTYEGILYKLVDGKMRELYFKLVHKDLYFFKNPVIRTSYPNAPALQKAFNAV